LFGIGQFQSHPQGMSARRCFIITGASKGIGLATAKLLAEQGHFPIGLARTTPASFPGEFIPTDLSDRAATAGVLEQVLSRHTVDGLVNNVGMVRPAPLEELRLEDLAAVMDLNLRPSIQCMQAILPGMKQRRYGRVVNVTSLVVAGVLFRSSYAAAKSALVSFTKSWALELAGLGITVNGVAPGPTDTELFNTNNPPGSESRQRYVNGVPMKRIADPGEVAAPICFLLSEAAGFITGQNLFVDGGSSIGRV
jgi:NAD(P)-dependent dehydrogenase (short-subunit alcohol dehydrogenase family)